VSQTCSTNPVFERLRLEDHEFKVSMVYRKKVSILKNTSKVCHFFVAGMFSYRCKCDLIIIRLSFVSHYQLIVPSRPGAQLKW
jgi:hypothetical protein